MSNQAGQFRTVQVHRVGRAPDGVTSDAAAVEEPLEIRLHGRPFAVVMRTPGDDRALAAGFLLSEGVVSGADDIGAVEHCRHPDTPDVHNVVDVYLMRSVAERLPAIFDDRRNVTATSACGVCGRVTIESLRMRVPPLSASTIFDRALVRDLPRRLRERQQTFDDTGGLHAAALFTPEGHCVRSAEDVGRHNAVDKVIGDMLLEGRLPLSAHALVVSGRTSYEIVQKAWLGGVELICAVSAPSTLAIDLAAEAGMTLLGFVRDGGFNIYTNPQRIAGL
jgi:FdhD protein